MKSESVQVMSMSSRALQLSKAVAMPRTTVVVSSEMSMSSVRVVSSGQVMTGASSSYREMYCSATALLPQSSSTVQIRIQLPGQTPLSGQASMEMERSSSQLSKASRGTCVGSVGSVSISQDATW